MEGVGSIMGCSPPGRSDQYMTFFLNEDMLYILIEIGLDFQLAFRSSCDIIGDVHCCSQHMFLDWNDVDHTNMHHIFFMIQ